MTDVKTGAEQNAEDRVRSTERPMTQPPKKLEEEREAANNTANQTDGNEHEVEGRLAVPYVKVEKRGFTKYTNKETGQLVKKLTNIKMETRSEEKPEYLKLHEEVLKSNKDPLELNMAYQKENK